MTINNNDATIDETNSADDKENDNSADSSTEKNNDAETQSPDGDDENNQEDPDKDLPFHKHPRWEKREKEWKDRFNDIEKRHQEELDEIRKAIEDKKAPNATPKIPSWFGGSEEQWEAYQADRKAELDNAKAEAIKEVRSASTAEEKAVAEATAFMQGEIAAIEQDETLNPSKGKVDPNKLLKFVLDNDLVDSKGRWNYKAGFRMMNAQGTSAQKTNNDRKKVAAATTTESKPETKPQAFKTSADFKKNKPW